MSSTPPRRPSLQRSNVPMQPMLTLSTVTSTSPPATSTTPPALSSSTSSTSSISPGSNAHTSRSSSISSTSSTPPKPRLRLSSLPEIRLPPSEEPMTMPSAPRVSFAEGWSFPSEQSQSIPAAGMSVRGQDAQALWGKMPDDISMGMGMGMNMMMDGGMHDAEMASWEVDADGDVAMIDAF